MVLSLALRSRVGPKGQAVIPKPIRDALGIHPGDEVSFRISEDRVFLEKQSGREALEEMLAMFPKTPEPRQLNWRRVWDEKYRKQR